MNDPAVDARVAGATSLSAEVPPEAPPEAPPTERVRVAVYARFARTGSAPTPEDLAAQTGLSAEETRRALKALHEHRDLVLDAQDPDRILMAHPFASIPLGFSVMGRRTLWWGGCAWDSFAIPHLRDDEPEVLVATRCQACDTPHAWVVGRAAPPAGTQVAHFLTPAHRIWDDVVHSCANQRLFCSEDCVDVWLRATGQPRGYVMDLPTLWRLARGWYAGRMEPGYVRREPASAAAYFAQVGLHGRFWGLAEPDQTPAPASPQAIQFHPRYLDAVRAGTKTKTTRFEDPATLGPARLVFESEPEVVLSAEVTAVKHCLVDELTDEDARAEALAVAAELREGLRRHYPNLTGSDEVDVITFRLRDNPGTGAD